MCQAIVKPAGISIDKQALRNAWDDNPHGAGMAIRRSDGSVVIAKGYMKFKKFYRAYRQVEQHDLLIHFRFATHGATNQANCHPFSIGDQAAMIHNGILNKWEPPTKGDTRSDTRYYIDNLLVPVIRESGMPPHDFINSAVGKAVIEATREHGKFAMLTPQGFTIFGEKQGEWRNGVWWSAGYPEFSRKEMFWDNKLWEHYEKAWDKEKANIASSTNTAGFKTTYNLDSRTGLLAPVTPLWEKEMLEKDIRGKYAQCTQCAKVGETYQMGVDAVCEDCWNVYAG